MMGYDLHMELPMVKDNEARYVAVFDPIDGSKNIGASLPVGTIFSIYATTVLVWTTETASTGSRWIRGGIYSFGEAYYRSYGEPVSKFLDSMKAAGTME